MEKRMETTITEQAAPAQTEVLPATDNQAVVSAQPVEAKADEQVQQRQKSKRELWKERVLAQKSKQSEQVVSEPVSSSAPAEVSSSPLQTVERQGDLPESRVRELIRQNEELNEAESLVKGDSVAEQYRLAEIASKREAIVREQKNNIMSYLDRIPAESKAEFCDNYNYYVPRLRETNPVLLNEITAQAGDLFPYMLDKFFEAINNGSQNYDEWAALPPPQVKARIKKIMASVHKFIAERQVPPSSTSPLSIVPKQSSAALTPAGNAGSYLQRRISDKLRSRGRL